VLECPDVKITNDQLNMHRMLYSYTHMATVGVKGLKYFYLFSWCNCTL